MSLRASRIDMPHYFFVQLFIETIGAQLSCRDYKPFCRYTLLEQQRHVPAQFRIRTADDTWIA